MRFILNYGSAALGLLIALGAASLAGCGDEGRPTDNLIVVGDDPSDLPIAGLTDDQMKRFDDGDALFEQPFREAQGLGPLYIRQACSSCHANDGKGPGAVTKMAAADAGFVFPYGQTVRPQMTAGASAPIELLPDVLSSVRIGPAVFGRGFLEAVEDAEIERVEREQAESGGPISGRIHRVKYQSEANPETAFHGHRPGDAGLIGRFGLKSRIATLDEFTADAFQGDMGITSPMRPNELPNPDGLVDDRHPGVDLSLQVINEVGDYVRALAIPKRKPSEPRGAQLFKQAGCASCHIPALRTRADYPLAPLAGIDAPVFTDFLLHDMGDELADGIRDGDASGREWRTAPLIGIRFLPSFLHDGRARTLRGAIENHGGTGSEAKESAEAFAALPAPDQALLLDHVSKL